MRADVLSLLINGQRYEYWQRLNVRHSIDELAASLSCEISGAGAGKQYSFSANDVAVVEMNGVTVSTVRLDDARRRVADNAHAVTIEARSLGRELIDCQYSITLKNQRLSDIVNRLCTLFKVPLNVIGETPLVPDFSMQAESPANAVLNAARAGNVLIYSAPNGGLVMSEPSAEAPVATLALGDNIKSYTINDEYRLRFSEYYVKSFDYAANSPRKSAVVDAGLSYFRPMHIVADRHGNALGALQRRAELERNRRSARAHSIGLELQGWGYWVGDTWHPWEINTQVRVVIADESIDEVMLIGDLDRSQDEQSGTITNMTVMHRDAFLGETQSKKQSNANVKKLKAKS